MVAKELCVRGELETEQRLQHIDPGFSSYSSTSFPFCWAAQPGLTESRKPSVRELVLTASNCNNCLQTPNSPELPVTPGYIIVWHPPASCGHHTCTQFNPSTGKVSPDIFDLLFTLVHFLLYSSAGSEVNMLLVNCFANSKLLSD